MNRLLILLFLVSFGYIVYYVIKLLIKQRLTQAENFMVMDEPNNKGEDNLSTRDSNYYLTTTLNPGKKAIVQLKQTHPNQNNYYYLSDKDALIEIPESPVIYRPSKLSYPKIKDKLTCVPENHPIREIIKKNQPYMWDEANIITYYDRPYYRDWRYSLQPIDIKFASNPEKYCQMNPSAYPCPEYFKNGGDSPHIPPF